MTFHHDRLLPHAGATLAGLAFAVALGGAAFAQSATPAKPVAPAAPTASADQPLPKPPTPEWIKICGKDPKANSQICGTENFLLADAGNVVGQIRVLDVKNGKETKRVFAAQIPQGFLLQPGVQLVIDAEKKPIAGKYTICFPNGCVAEVPLSDDNLAKLKKGDLVTLFAANPAGQWVGAKASLAGFTKAYEGQPTDPKEYQAKRKAFQDAENELQSGLLKRAEAQRQKLEAEQAAKKPATPAPTKK